MKYFFLLLLSTLSYAAPCHQLRIAVIDSGLNLNDPRFTHLCKTGHKNFVTGETIEDTVSHGTHIAGLIQKYARDANYCMLIYKYFSYRNMDNNDKIFVSAIEEAIENKADVINISGGGIGFNEEEALLIANNPKVTFVVSAGNSGKNLDIPGNEFYPASLFYKNIRVVKNIDSNGVPSKSSNYSSRLSYWEIGESVLSYLPNGKEGYLSGTSQSAAIFQENLLTPCQNRATLDK